MGYFNKFILYYYNIKRKFKNLFYRYPFFSSSNFVPNYSSQKLSDSKGSIFFGYHDKIPFNKKDDKILSMYSDGSDFNSKNKTIQIGYFKKNNKGQFINKFIPFSSSNSWCWQQGCMLQWLQNSETDKAIYNTIVDGEFGSEIYCFDNERIIKKNKYPIYSLSANGNFASSLNFSALGLFRPGYGYDNFKYRCEDVIPKDDGLFCINLKTDDMELLVSLYQLSQKVNKPKQYNHYINHCSFSPDSKKISFFHVMKHKFNSSKKIRFCVYDLNSKLNKCVEEDLLISHYCWIDNDNLLLSTRDKYLRWRYKIYNINNNIISESEIKFYTDGHPMISPVNKNIFVTDTSYRDKNQNLHLLISNVKNKTLNKLKSFFIPYAFKGEVRCDLHPRWNWKADKISIDICVNGKREMEIIYLY